MQATVQQYTAQDSEIPESNQEDENDQILVHESSANVFDCDVSLDGSWQRRGYASLNGFISTIERVSDKVNIDIMTKDCRSCKYWDGKEEEPEYEKWILSHKCMINHEGSSGSMEGVVRIFNRSVKKNGLRYTNYIGDSSAFKVSESNPYPNKPVEKLECVGHIQKRVGAGLLSLVKEQRYRR